MRFFTLSTVVVLMSLPQGAVAQQAPTTRKQELIREFLAVIDMRANGLKMMDTMVAQLSQQYPAIAEARLNSDPDVTPAQRKRAMEVISQDTISRSKRFMELLKQEIDFGQMLEGIALSLYEKHFTEDELTDMIAFYKTPTGKKTLTVAPQLLADSIQQAQEKLMPAITKVMTLLAAEDKENLKRVK